MSKSWFFAGVSLILGVVMACAKATGGVSGAEMVTLDEAVEEFEITEENSEEAGLSTNREPEKLEDQNIVDLESAGDAD